jgi:hypothetical protein
VRNPAGATYGEHGVAVTHDGDVGALQHHRPPRWRST